MTSLKDTVMILPAVRTSTVAIWEHENWICNRPLVGCVSSTKSSLFYSVSSFRKSFSLPLLHIRGHRLAVSEICVYRRVRLVMKSTYQPHYVCSVRLSACISSVPTGWIFVKFYIRNFYWNLSRKSKFVYCRTKISDTLLEDLSIFDCCRRHNFP
jgi:hypothetical protein